MTRYQSKIISNSANNYTHKSYFTTWHIIIWQEGQNIYKYLYGHKSRVKGSKIVITYVVMTKNNFEGKIHSCIRMHYKVCVTTPLSMN